MKLYAISDLHVGYKQNRQLETLREYPDDWLIIAGDVGETEEQLAWALSIAVTRFQKVFWVPGNHELWTVTPHGLRGEEKYRSMVDVCREFEVITPEDPYVVWPDPNMPCMLVPLFLLYDYSFRPDEISESEA